MASTRTSTAQYDFMAYASPIPTTDRNRFASMYGFMGVTSAIPKRASLPDSRSLPPHTPILRMKVRSNWTYTAAGTEWPFTSPARQDVLRGNRGVQKRYKIDPDRIILRGFSMGGCGAWHIALHYPGFFAAAEIGAGTWPRRSQMPGFPPYQQGPLRIWENINDWALNAFNLPLAGHDGDSETGLSSIPPFRRELRRAANWNPPSECREQLQREGYPSEGDPYELHAQGYGSDLPHF